MKSHDCHVIMERLLPVCLRELLPLHIWKAITEISQFFRDLCAPTITLSEMDRLHKNVAEILCKLEKLFPPAFFNSMEHLPVHLPHEAYIGGPVQYRWMYPFERWVIVIVYTPLLISSELWFTIHMYSLLTGTLTTWNVKWGTRQGLKALYAMHTWLRRYPISAHSIFSRRLIPSRGTWVEMHIMLWKANMVSMSLNCLGRIVWTCNEW